MKYSLLIGIGILNTILNGTAATDLTHQIIYYHTMYNRTVRAIEMDKIDFANVKFQSHPLDETKSETVIPGRID